MRRELVLDRLVVGRRGFCAGPFDLAATRGSTLALIGPNGGGKTTLLRTLAGLMPPLSGRLVRPGIDTAFLPAPGSLDAPFSARHMVALGRAGRRGSFAAALGRADRDAAMCAMETFGIAGLADRRFDALSSGQRQLVLLARLWVQDAPLCLLDEPTAMLDPVQSAKVWNILASLAADGRTLVVATHDLDWARSAGQVLGVGTQVPLTLPGKALSKAILSEAFGAPIG